MCQWLGARLVWAGSNLIVFVCMAGTALISLVSLRQYSDGVQHVIGANETTKVASLVVFAILGIPLAVSILMLDLATSFSHFFISATEDMRFTLLIYISNGIITPPVSTDTCNLCCRSLIVYPFLSLPN